MKFTTILFILMSLLSCGKGKTVYLSYQIIDNISVSPDNKKILFTYSINNIDTNKLVSSLYILNIDNKSLKFLDQEISSIKNLDWLPDSENFILIDNLNKSYKYSLEDNQKSFYKDNMQDIVFSYDGTKSIFKALNKNDYKYYISDQLQVQKKN